MFFGNKQLFKAYFSTKLKKNLTGFSNGGLQATEHFEEFIAAS